MPQENYDEVVRLYDVAEANYQAAIAKQSASDAKVQSLQEQIQEAGGLLAGQVQRHSTMMAFVDDFWLLGVIFIPIIPCLLLLGRYRAKGKPDVH